MDTLGPRGEDKVPKQAAIASGLVIMFLIVKLYLVCIKICRFPTQNPLNLVQINKAAT